VLSLYGQRGVDWLWRLLARLPFATHTRVAPLLAKLKTFVQNLVDGFAILTRGKALPGILLSSAGVWGGYYVLNYIFMATFNMTDLPATAAALVLCATALSMVVPSSPGAIGVFEWAAAQALAVFGVGDSQAYGYAFGLHIYTNVVLIALGAWGLIAEGVSYAAIKSAAIEPRPAPPAPADTHPAE
jgi:uncharacterized membrane protein YbhN (UPF0104 family)